MRISGYRVAYALLLAALMVMAAPAYASNPRPEGAKPLSSVTLSIEVPPGSYYVVKVDASSGKVIPESIEKPKLPPIAYEALKHVPAWIRPLLERQFYLLLQGDMEAKARSIPSAGDVNGDGVADIALGSSQGLIYVYVNVGRPYEPLFKLYTTINVTRDAGLGNETYVAPAIGDLDGDGLPDIVVGLANGSLLFYRNTGSPKAPQWSLVPGYFGNLSVGGYAAPYLYDVDHDGDLDLVVGSAEGLIHCFLNKGTPASPRWVEDPQYFPAWIENWYDGRGPHYEGVWVGNYSKPALFEYGGTEYLLMGNDKGEVYLFRSTGNSTGYPSWSNMGKLPYIETSSYAAPEVADLNGDGIVDLILGSGDGHVYLARNYGSPIFPLFRAWPSEAEKYLLANWFWGPAYYPTLDYIPVLSTDTKYVEHYAKLILNTTKPYIDEVAYAIAVDRPSNLKMLADRNGSYLYVLNAESIYNISKQLSYVKVVDHGNYTTLAYKTEHGWKEMPPEIYYKYLVTFSRYIIAPWAWPQRYQGHFFRTFLPYDHRYNISLLERVANASTLYQAAYLVDYWLRVDIGAYWHRGTKYWKPPGWYNIYLHLNDTEWTIYCGEFAIIYEVAARAVLIPTVNIVDIAEDHQFDNFWYNGTWHHVDASSGSPGINGTWKEYFDPPRGLAGWYKNKGFSYPIEWEENGMYDVPWRSPVPYAPSGMLANLTFKVVDINGRPIDGARVEVWSHWTIESGYDTAPYIAGFTFTDMDGMAYFPMLGLGRTHNFTVIVTSRIGSTMFEIHLEKGGNYSFTVVIPHSLPQTPKAKLGEVKLTTPYYVKARARVVGGEQNPPTWIHILYALFGYKYYVELKHGVYIDLYALTPSGYRAFAENKPFTAVYAAEHSTGADTGFIPIAPNGTLYIVISNRRSVTTSVKVELTVTLYKDSEAPIALITYPGNGAILNTSTVTVRFGSTSSDVAYYEVSVDGSPYVKVTGNTYTLKGLSDGTHTVTVRAVDISGNRGEPVSVTFKVDTTPPEVVLENIADGSIVLNKTITVNGKVAGGVKLWLNGEEVSLAPDGSFRVKLSLQPGMNKLEFKAVDEAGNTRTVDVRVYYYPELATKGELENATKTLAGEIVKNSKAVYYGVHQDLEGALSELKRAISSSSESLSKNLESTKGSILSQLGSLGNEIKSTRENIITSITSLNTSISSSLNKTGSTLSQKIDKLHTTIGYATSATIVILAVIALAEGFLLARRK